MQAQHIINFLKSVMGSNMDWSIVEGVIYIDHVAKCHP